MGVQWEEEKVGGNNHWWGCSGEERRWVEKIIKKRLKIKVGVGAKCSNSLGLVVHNKSTVDELQLSIGN